MFLIDEPVDLDILIGFLTYIKDSQNLTCTSTTCPVLFKWIAGSSLPGLRPENFISNKLPHDAEVAGTETTL